MVYNLRTAGNPLNYVTAVRDLVQRADPRLPLADVKSQSARIAQTINQEIAFARLCTAFALLALAIACVGLYGTMSYNVARRTGEIGIRMALGAQRSRVLCMVLREVLVLAGVGLAIGVPIALAASGVVESFLFGMKPNDPLALTRSVVTAEDGHLLNSVAGRCSQLVTRPQERATRFSARSSGPGSRPARRGGTRRRLPPA
jgi:macrolide transport system ATP-binding/permease protein